MSTLLQHTKAELRRAGLFDADSDYGGDIAASVTALMETLVAYGHSGGSLDRTLEVFNRVAAQRQITPLTGDDDEWAPPREGLLQNLRNPMVFKSEKTGKAYRVVGHQVTMDISFPCDP